MSLIAFHRFLIATGIAFCIGFAAWEVRAWMRTDDTTMLLLGITFAILGAGLLLYLRRLNRFLGYERDRS